MAFCLLKEAYIQLTSFLFQIPLPSNENSFSPLFNSILPASFPTSPQLIQAIKTFPPKFCEKPIRYALIIRVFNRAEFQLNSQLPFAREYIP